MERRDGDGGRPHRQDLLQLPQHGQGEPRRQGGRRVSANQAQPSFSDVVIKKGEKKTKKQRQRKSNKVGGDNVLKEEADECEINGALNYETTAARSETKVEEEKLKLRRTSSPTLMTRASGSS